ncbi:MAG: polymer-forming cytoskeletal protein [Holophagales bacterium]|nr:polymer-forming cytoskeletal protein [Holophagales bacterium]
MSWFKQRDSVDEPKPIVPPSRQQPRAATPRRSDPVPGAAAHVGSTHVAAGSEVEGEISGNAELLVEGKVEGQIRLESKVVIGQQGMVEGTIEAVTVEVAGHVKGDIIGRERVEILTSGKLEGDVDSPKVVIADGAFFKGKVDMTGSNRPATAKAGSEKAGGAGGDGGKTGTRSAAGAPGGAADKTDSAEADSTKADSTKAESTKADSAKAGSAAGARDPGAAAARGNDEKKLDRPVGAVRPGGPNPRRR